MQQLNPVKRPRGRPPKKTDGQLDTKDQLIRQGTAILTEKGFSSTGIGEILRDINIPKGSFYHYFSSKDEFGLAVVENFGAFFARKLDKWLLNTDRTPLDRLEDFIEDAKDGMRRYEFRRGCLIGNLGQELGSLSEDFREPLETIFLDWQGRVARCLDEAKASGHIPTVLNTEEMAAFFWIGWEGAILRSKLVKSTDPLDLFASVFFSSLSLPPPQ
ncbi:MAG: TetR/AcrR family transcriptional regulator [Sneathiella sp.]